LGIDTDNSGDISYEEFMLFENLKNKEYKSIEEIVDCKYLI
jgi:hypothetical protein